MGYNEIITKDSMSDLYDLNNQLTWEFVNPSWPGSLLDLFGDVLANADAENAKILKDLGPKVFSATLIENRLA